MNKSETKYESISNKFGAINLIDGQYIDESIMEISIDIRHHYNYYLLVSR